jgi:hypothetical protein
MRSCARRSFDDETIFIAFVICCVDFTARTRRRMSISDGMMVVACGTKNDGTKNTGGAVEPREDSSPAATRSGFSVQMFVRRSTFFVHVLCCAFCVRFFVLRSAALTRERRRNSR